MSILPPNLVIVDFCKEYNLASWMIVDDGVMGGVSSGHFKLDADGNGLFYGNVSLENNGGFSSVKHNFSPIPVKNYKKIILSVKGDGKDYQFRVKHKSDDYQSYISIFSTTGEWQKVEINLGAMYPSFRGRKLAMPDFDHDSIEEIRFLIANKKNEKFQLVIDRIELE